VARDIKRIMKGKKRYQRMAKELGIPWEMIGLISLMETGCRFTRHMHCGTSLKRRTTLVPKGRPRTGKAPFTWEESCRDALSKAPHNLAAIKDWSVERMLYELEKYNGWGYAMYHKTVPSPYLWSGTTVYKRGKYVRDGKWSSRAVSKQLGVAPILLELLKGRRYTKKEIVKSSRKLRAADKIQKASAGVAGLGATLVSSDSLGLISSKLDTVRGFVIDQQSTIIVVLICAALLYTWYVKDKSYEDHKAGRYQPSGLDDESLDPYDDVLLTDSSDDFADLEERDERDYEKADNA
jgi:lysozyme family protein